MKNKVKCKICKKYFRAITNTHLENIHNITIEKYKKLFPNCNLHSMSCKCFICKAKRNETKNMNNHKDNCQCSFCKQMRGEFKGKNYPFHNRIHKSDCQCFICKSKRREYFGENDRFNNHKFNCNCSFCKAMRGELKKENHPNWQGGISFEEYGPEFDFSLKEKIRKRDNWTCQLCSKLQNENKRKLHVHHIDYNKKNCKKENLITLCTNCHVKTNRKRNYWTRKFYEVKNESIKMA